MTASAAELARQHPAGAATSLDQAPAALPAAGRRSDLNAFISLDEAGALEAAARADDELRAGQPRGPLHGLPIAIKDNLCARGQVTTCGSRLLEGWVAPYDATAVARLRDAGAVLVGKTNLDEFAMGSSSENSGFGPVLHPVDSGRVPGGSSGGSAAAVAAGVVPLALGTDTGGSVRQPAALCGVVGVKPTWGRVSRWGLVAFASSLDVVGPVAGDVAGARALLHAISGHDPRDSTSLSAPAVDLPPDGRRLRVGVPAEYSAPLAPDAADALRAGLEGLGDVDLVDIALPHTRFAAATYYVLASAEASSNLARFDGVRYGQRRGGPDAGLGELYEASRTEGFGPEVQRRILLGTFALSAGYHDAYYGKAQAARSAISADFDAAWEEVDAIVSLTSPTTAFELGAKTRDPVQMYLSDIFTIPASLAGVPAVSVPCGADAAGLPWGLQLIGPAWSEDRLLDLAQRVEASA